MVILRPEEPLDKIANPFLILKGSMKQEFQKCSVTWEMIFLYQMQFGLHKEVLDVLSPKF